MTKLIRYYDWVWLLTLVLSLIYTPASSQYRLQVFKTDSIPGQSLNDLTLQTDFRNRLACEQYLNHLPTALAAKGYMTASVDSIHYDSAYAAAYLYLGRQFELESLNTAGVDERLLEISGWKLRDYHHRPFKPADLQDMQKQVLNYLENNGYPFARVYLDSFTFRENRISAALKVDKGPLYRIDSIRVFGTVHLSKAFLARYLDIPNRSIYRKEKLLAVSRKILELPYVQEQKSWDLTMLGTGSILNLYLKPRRSSQVNVLVGLLPANDQTINNKILVTGEANINLRNSLGNGESIGLNWQQLQYKSPRLDLSFQQPYIFGSAFGLSAAFNLLKKDTSYINLSLVAGVQYAVSANKAGRVFIQNLKTNLLSVDTGYVKAFKRLPPQIDINIVSLGIDYEYNNTNFRFNPRSGNAFQSVLSGGTRKVRKNNIIVNLYDPNFSYVSLYDTVKENSYQFRAIINAAHYFPLGSHSTLKSAINGAWVESPQLFRNELFQIGGYKLLRGFDEESIFASRYAVASLEYRYIIGLNSYLFSFADFGLTTNKAASPEQKNSFLGFGAGLAFETKAGIFNISYAVGKRDDTKFNPRQAKIHLGYVAFF